MISIFGLISLPILPYIIEVSWSANESQRCSSLHILTEYFIDQKKYFYLIMLHMYAAIYVGATGMLSTGTILITCLQHACGMFKVARLRDVQGC